MEISGSKPALLDGMAFNDIPNTLDSVERVQFIEYRPINQVSAQNPIDIIIPGSGDYIDMSRSLLHVKFRSPWSAQMDTPMTIDTDYVSHGKLDSFNQVESLMNSIIAFYNLYTGFDIDLKDKDLWCITPEEFFHAYAYYVFDLKAGLGDNYLQIIQKANLR